ncbi:hypothetical protein BC826DRAFT_1108858 [Russula brevipes]|nr:hypothetical protein BC826DRAFT_1108858 [Russula brevipes]
MAAGPPSELNPTAAPFIPGQAHLQANSAEPSVEASTDEADDDHSVQEAAEEEDTELAEEADGAEIMEPVGTTFMEVSEETLAEQQSAAKTLQSYYRRLLTGRTHRIANPELGLANFRRAQFEAFAKAAADTTVWPSKSLYRPVFLGALPHLLASLDYALSTGIEELMERRTYLTTTIKRIKALRTTLEAPSQFHTQRDLKRLEGHVINVSAVVNEIPRAKEELVFDMEMAGAWRRHVKERQKPPKVEKPLLNTDDLDDVFYFSPMSV